MRKLSLKFGADRESAADEDDDPPPPPPQPRDENPGRAIKDGSGGLIKK